MDINLTSQVLTFANLAAFPGTGVVKTIYIATDTDTPYYWDGATYVSIGGSGGGVQSVTGDGVDNTDPLNPTLTFPTANDIGALTSANITGTITNGVTDKAPSEDAVFDALALKQNIVSGVDDTEIGYLNGVTSSIQTQLDRKGYVVQSRFYAALSPSDSTTYYPTYTFASNITTGSARSRHKTLKSGTTINLGWIHNCTAGSNEGVSLVVSNITAGTSVTATTTIDMSIASFNGSYTGLSLTYSIGDLIEVSVITPIWSSNPVSLFFCVDLHLV